MRLFCDQCGTEFGETTLRADSKFCSICGKPLSDYIKEQSGNLFKSSPKTARTNHFTGSPKPLSPSSKKRKPVEEEEEESASDGLRKSRRTAARQQQKTAQTDGGVDVTDETSTEENPESEEADRQGLGKGKRIRKITQRYMDEVTTVNTTPATRSKEGPTSPSKKHNQSLEQILNSSPTSGQKPSYDRAAQTVPISISAFKLPPAIQIPDKATNQSRVYRRDVIALVRGGSLKVTFPYPRNRSEGPMYACLKESEQDFLPKAPGEHGIVVAKSLPEGLPKTGFSLFIKRKKNTDWAYCGTYKVLHTFKVSTEQWAAFGDRTRTHKVSGTLRSAWGKAWCVGKGVEPTDEGMMRALDMGVLSWQASVIECIGFDTKLVQQLLRGF